MTAFGEFLQVLSNSNRPSDTSFLIGGGFCYISSGRGTGPYIILILCMHHVISKYQNDIFMRLIWIRRMKISLFLYFSNTEEKYFQ